MHPETLTPFFKKGIISPLALYIYNMFFLKKKKKEDKLFFPQSFVVI